MVNLIEKIKRLVEDVPMCSDKHYKRQQTPKELRLKILERTECYLCEGKRKRNFLVHHVQPDGPSIVDNLDLLCLTCHGWIHHMLHKLKGYRTVSHFFYH